MDLIDLAQIKFNFPEYIIEIGVMSDKSQRKETVELGINNAEILYINENGSPLRNLPARPVLDLTIKWANDTNLIRETLNKAIDAYLVNYDEKDVDKIVDRMCIKIQSHARRIIYDNDGTLAPNAPSTIKKKGDNHPLFDTGQLARSITCRAIKIKGGKTNGK